MYIYACLRMTSQFFGGEFDEHYIYLFIFIERERERDS